MRAGHPSNENATVGTSTYDDASSIIFLSFLGGWDPREGFRTSKSFATRVIALFVGYKLWISLVPEGDIKQSNLFSIRLILDTYHVINGGDVVGML